MGPKAVHVGVVAEEGAVAAGRVVVALGLAADFGVEVLVLGLGQQQVVGVPEVVPGLGLGLEVQLHEVGAVFAADFHVAIYQRVERLLAHARQAQRAHRVPGALLVVPAQVHLAQQHGVVGQLGRELGQWVGGALAHGVGLHALVADELPELVELVGRAVLRLGRALGDAQQLGGHDFHGLGRHIDVDTQQGVHAVAGAVGVGRAHAAAHHLVVLGRVDERHRPAEAERIGEVGVGERGALVGVHVGGVLAGDAVLALLVVVAQLAVHLEHGHVGGVGHGGRVQRVELVALVRHEQAGHERGAVLGLDALQVQAKVLGVDGVLHRNPLGGALLLAKLQLHLPVEHKAAALGVELHVAAVADARRQLVLAGGAHHGRGHGGRAGGGAAVLVGGGLGAPALAALVVDGGQQKGRVGLKVAEAQGHRVAGGFHHVFGVAGQGHLREHLDVALGEAVELGQRVEHHGGVAEAPELAVGPDAHLARVGQHPGVGGGDVGHPAHLHAVLGQVVHGRGGLEAQALLVGVGRVEI